MKRKENTGKHFGISSKTAHISNHFSTGKRPKLFTATFVVGFCIKLKRKLIH